MEFEFDTVSFNGRGVSLSIRLNELSESVSWCPLGCNTVKLAVLAPPRYDGRMSEQGFSHATEKQNA